MHIYRKHLLGRMGLGLAFAAATVPGARAHAIQRLLFDAQTQARLLKEGLAPRAAAFAPDQRYPSGRVLQQEVFKAVC